MSVQEPDLLHYGPVPFWFWNDRLELPELRRQLRLMREGGVRNFIIHARWGLKTPYLSPLWWRQVKAALAEAKAQGMRAWLYDEYNYPSGIGGFKISRQRRYRERFLASATARTRAGAAVRLKLPQGARVAVQAFPMRHGRLLASQSLQLGQGRAGRILRWAPPDRREWMLAAFCMQVEPFRGSGRYSVNYLAPEPTRAFIRLTHEAYARHLGPDLGKAAPVFFLDEPRFNNALPWDERFPAWFRQRLGYDLLPRLALLLHPGTDGEAARVRQDYHGLLGQLFSEHFFKPIGRWCRAHKVKLTGHLMAEETLGASTRFSGDGLAPYRHFDWPGVDHLGKGLGGLAPKIVASQAALQGKDRVACETFAGCGQGFHPQEMQLMTHWLFSQGVNLIIPHAFFYAMRTRRQRADWPPSMFFQWEHWPSYPLYSERVARLSKALSGGQAVAELALLHPGRAFRAAYAADPAFKTGYFAKGPRLGGARALELERWFQAVGRGLQNGHRSFQVLGDGQFEHLGRFRAILLPADAGLDEDDQAKLKAFQARGGKVFSGDDPRRLLTRLERGLPADLRLLGPAGLHGRRAPLSAAIHDPYVHRGLKEDLKADRCGVAAYRYRKDGEELLLLANLRTRVSSFQVRLRAAGGKLDLRWPGDGRCEPAPCRRLADGSIAFKVRLPAGEAVLAALR
jgi:hypothetical protein